MKQRIVDDSALHKTLPQDRSCPDSVVTTVGATPGATETPQQMPSWPHDFQDEIKDLFVVSRGFSDNSAADYLDTMTPKQPLYQPTKHTIDNMCG